MNHTKQITIGQVKKIASEVSKRWKFVNHNSYYNCIDTKTGQKSNDGGDYNFASYYFDYKVECLYLEMIGENYNYLKDWQTYGVKETQERQRYMYKIQMEVIKLLCGFEVKKLEIK